MILETKDQITQVPSKIKCDRCGLEARSDDKSGEFDEFTIIHQSCGYYNNTFGDLSHIEADLCQYCTFKLLSPFVRLKEHGYGPYEATREAAVSRIESAIKRGVKTE